MSMTREEAIKKHREMWNWIADWIERCESTCNIDILKEYYIYTNEDIIMYNVYKEFYNCCYCCVYADNNCNRCPVEWPSTAKEFMCEVTDNEYTDDGLWLECFASKDWKEQVELARQIANLPERNIILEE